MASKQDAFLRNSYETREAFNEALHGDDSVTHDVDLVVLAGCLVVIPEINGGSISAIGSSTFIRP